MSAVVDLALQKALAAEIKARRAEQEISQNGLAAFSDLQPLFIVRLERASSGVSLAAFLKLAAGLSTDPAELLAATMKRYRKERRLAESSSAKGAGDQTSTKSSSRKAEFSNTRRRLPRG